MSAHRPISNQNAKPLTLADALDRACDAAEAFNAYRGDGPTWNILNQGVYDAEQDLRAMLSDLGADKDRLDRAIKCGVLW